MRISTDTFQNNALYYMEQLDAAIAKTQNQLSSGQQIQNAADDPVGMTEVNQLGSQLSASQQYTTNGNAVNTSLQLEEQALSDATNVLQSARDLAVQANNGSLTTADRQGIATQQQQQLQDLIGIGNRVDGNGHYLFSGYSDTTQPFAQSAGGVSYAGTQGVRQVQIGANHFVSAGDSGDSVFMNIPAGNGTFTTAATAGNSGTASIDGGTVTNAAAWLPDTYTLSFTSPTQYQVVNSSNAVVASGSYTSGQAIAFNGVQVTVNGTPASGDSFSIATAGKASVFSTLSNLIGTLSSGTQTTGQLATQIGGALQQIDGAINQFSTVSASVGARLNSVTASQSTGQAEQTDLKGSISQISDTDYAAAVTRLSSEQITLQAAQQSYALIAKLSLFNYVS
jgi:flagellar hook-associated protein 3 FlgL